MCLFLQIRADVDSFDNYLDKFMRQDLTYNRILIKIFAYLASLFLVKIIIGLRPQLFGC